MIAHSNQLDSKFLLYPYNGTELCTIVPLLAPMISKFKISSTNCEWCVLNKLTKFPFVLNFQTQSRYL